MPNYSDITGHRFGRLVAQRHNGSSKQGHALWLCQCDCGTKFVAFATNLKRGLTRSCGCLLKTIMTTHGHARDYTTTPEYTAWKHLKQRCCNPNDRGFVNYGDRGITICERWRSFENFLTDMGPRPAGLYSIERVDNDGDYTPDNCEWIPMADQPKNRRPRSKRPTRCS